MDVCKCKTVLNHDKLRGNQPVEQASANERIYLDTCPASFVLCLATDRGACRGLSGLSSITLKSLRGNKNTARQ
jgi:hypothetical protein